MTTTQPGISRDAIATVGRARRRNPMERVIEALATGMGNGIGWMAETGILFAIFAIIWVAFGAALIFSQGSVDQAWQTIRALPFIVQIVVWVLFLPVMIGLWAWETTWPLIVRLLVVLSLAGWNLFMFLPRALQAKP